MSWQKEYIDKLDEMTIKRLPEPYKTWCEMGEKPYPWWKVAYMWPTYKALRKLEKWFPSLGDRIVEMEGAINRWYPGISHKWYPYGMSFFTSDVPDEILFPAMEEAETDFISDQIDAARERVKYGPIL